MKLDRLTYSVVRLLLPLQEVKKIERQMERSVRHVRGDSFFQIDAS